MNQSEKSSSGEAVEPRPNSGGVGDVTSLTKEADVLLELISLATAEQDRLKAEMKAEYEAVSAKYKDSLGSANARVASLAETLISLSLLHRADIFGDRDRVDLKHGALLFKVIERVHQGRQVKDRLLEMEAMGIGGLPLKRAVSVDWDGLKAWSDQALKNIGTRCDKFDVIEYELFGAGVGAAGGSGAPTDSE